LARLMPRARSRKLNRFERMLERVAATRAGGWFFVHVAHHVDPFLLRASKGRVSLAPGQPIALVTVKGAKSGVPRQTPLLFASDGDDIILLASNAGSTRHPAWYHNLRANPRADVIAPGGRSGRYVAHEAEGAERERLWEIAADLYAGYDVYQGRAGGRRIPVMVLSPVP
jgi:deazaflavin-dependent oxidoreductase (nitroreductase family)